MFWKALKRKSRTNSTIKICPRCQKPSLSKIMPIGFLNTEYYKCNNCDYEGAFYLEIDSEQNVESIEDLEDLKRLYPDDVEPESDHNSSKSNPS